MAGRIVTEDSAFSFKRVSTDDLLSLFTAEYTKGVLEEQTELAKRIIKEFKRRGLYICGNCQGYTTVHEHGIDRHCMKCEKGLILIKEVE